MVARILSACFNTISSHMCVHFCKLYARFLIPPHACNLPLDLSLACFRAFRLLTYSFHSYVYPEMGFLFFWFLSCIACCLSCFLNCMRSGKLHTCFLPPVCKHPGNSLVYFPAFLVADIGIIFVLVFYLCCEHVCNSPVCFIPFLSSFFLAFRLPTF